MSGLNNGTITFTATATDAAGNTTMVTKTATASGLVGHSSLLTGNSGGGLFLRSGDTVSIYGTPGNDSFQFEASASGATVTLNGVSHEYDSSVVNFVFDGGGGNDSATLTGSSGDDTATLGLGHGTLVVAHYNVTVSNVTSLGR